jgi:hypothetical protein
MLAKAVPRRHLQQTSGAMASALRGAVAHLCVLVDVE